MDMIKGSINPWEKESSLFIPMIDWRDYILQPHFLFIG